MSEAAAEARPRLIRAEMLAMGAATLLTGLGAGLFGMALALLLHEIQHLAFGYSLNAVISEESFLQGVEAASPLHRLLAVGTGGLVAGLGWWAVYRFGAPLVSIKAAVAKPERAMPVGTTIGHALLQIVTIALGSPLGREVAPREIGALLAGHLARRMGLSLEQVRILIACGAGAGLAAVYNVPLAGALFVMEVLVGSFALPVVVPALVSSVLAAFVAWSGLGNEHQYVLPDLRISGSLVVWSVLAGPVLGVAGWGYSLLAGFARRHAPRDSWIIWRCLAVFLIIGLLATPFPQLLGNGKGPIQLGLDGELSGHLALILLGLKLLATTACLLAGAEGGLLTPGLTIGALLGVATGAVWNLLCPGVQGGAFALVGGAAFLAVSMQMPITAVLLALEFTRMDQDFLIPLLLAVSGAMVAAHLCARCVGGRA